MAMKAIISPYEDTVRHGETVSMPSVVIDTDAQEFDSSDIPASILDAVDGERLIFLDDTAHAQAVSFGYTEVDV